MVVDQVIEQTIAKKNPSCVGLDPDMDKIPKCYKEIAGSPTEVIWKWACDVIDCIEDIVGIIKPQMAFYEIYGGDGMDVFARIVQYAHKKGMVVIDDCKRNDIGNTAKAYAYAHLATDGPINADFMTVSPFLGTDSMEPFIELAIREKKGLFILVKTSNPSSVQISDSRNEKNQKVRNWLADYVHVNGKKCVGENGYSSIGAVVGATFPEEAKELRRIMPGNYFLVPGFGAQGGTVEDIVTCFNPDGLGAVVNSSRGILYQYTNIQEFDNSRTMYLDIVREQAVLMQQQIYGELKNKYAEMVY